MGPCNLLPIITLTKHDPKCSPDAAPASTGTGAPEQVAVTRYMLAAAIRASVEETFSDPLVYGPMPRETCVDRIIAGTNDRVFRQ